MNQLPLKRHAAAFLLIFLGTAAAAQNFDITQHSIYYPAPNKPWQFRKEAALSQVKLPFDWLEASVQAPLLQFHGTYGLPANFTLDSRFSTIYVANHLSLGARWGYRINNLSFSAGYDVAYVFGALTKFGFNSSVSSWVNYPNFAIGFRSHDITFTIRTEFSIVTTLYSKQGDNVIEQDRNFYNGNSIGAYVEQRLWKDHVLVLGLKNTYARYHFMGWPAFSTFNRFYNIPEFYIGLVL